MYVIFIQDLIELLRGVNALGYGNQKVFDVR